MLFKNFNFFRPGTPEEQDGTWQGPPWPDHAEREGQRGVHDRLHQQRLRGGRPRLLQRPQERVRPHAAGRNALAV